MDEAGRGPAIGPIVFGIVLVTPEQEDHLISLGIRDSKTLSSTKREEFARKIEEISSYHATLVVSAMKIDELMEKGTNLNKIEVLSFRQLLKPYGPLEVDDVVQAMVTAATAPDISDRVINIGSGTEISVRELVRIIQTQTDSKAEVIYNPRSNPGVARMCADLSLAKEKLNYQPEITLEEGLALTIEHDSRFQR